MEAAYSMEDGMLKRYSPLVPYPLFPCAGLKCLCGDLTQPTDAAIRAGRIADSSPAAKQAKHDASEGELILPGVSVSVANCHGHNSHDDQDQAVEKINIDVDSNDTDDVLSALNAAARPPPPAAADQPIGAGVFLAECEAEGYCFKAVHRLPDRTTTSFR